MGAVMLLVLGLAACGDSGSIDTSSGSSPSPTAVASTTTVTDTALPQVVHARVGDTVNVMLHSNASTGYQWVAQDLNDAAVLKQEGDAKIIAPKKAQAGAPGHTQFTFVVMKEGVDEIGFWYQPPSSGPAGATWALVVKASAGHVPVNVDAGEDYTAETAQLRTGDNLLVSIDDASNAGRHSWKMIGGAPLVKLVSQKFSHGTQQMTFSGVSAGTGTLVLVNRPTGDPPLQTYALPLAIKAPKAPVTIQLNKNSANQNVLAKGGDTIQVSLEDQPSTDFQWKFQKPNAKVLKQVGQPKFFPNNSMMGSKGKMVWTFSVVGAGKTPLIADYQSVPADAMPVKTWQVNVAAKPGFTPKTVAGNSTSAADSVHAAAGRPDQAQAGRQRGDVVQACLQQAARRGQAREAGTGRRDLVHGEAAWRHDAGHGGDGLERLSRPGLRVLGHRRQGQAADRRRRRRAQGRQAHRGERG